MIWPFKTAPKTETKVPEFTDIKFGVHLYKPQIDITPYEVALLLPMFRTGWGLINYQPYVEKNNLTRHFVKVEE